jgi:hypothetical protein
MDQLWNSNMNNYNLLQALRSQNKKAYNIKKPKKSESSNVKTQRTD